MRYRIFCTILVIVIAVIVGIVIESGSQEPPQYNCVVTEPETNIYDGDTIKDVRILVKSTDAFEASDFGNPYPGIFITEKGIEVEIDIRINGIDTPEKRVSSKYPDGTPRSKASRQLERDASKKAQQALYNFLYLNDFKFTLSDLKLGKYAGRIIGTISVKEVDVSQYLIREGHAFAYDGGTKINWARYLDKMNRLE